MNGSDPNAAGEAALRRNIGEAIAASAGLHPGIIAEAVVARLLAAYELTPRETAHREQRKNHEERIRRFSHEVYRLVEDPVGRVPVDEIFARVAKAFIVAPRPSAPADPPDGRT